MTARTELTKALLEALREVHGLRPARLSTRQETFWVPWDLDAMTVDLGADQVEVRLVALALPLPPLLDRAAAALRPVLRDTDWAEARLRLVVTDIDASALSGIET